MFFLWPQGGMIKVFMNEVPFFSEQRKNWGRNEPLPNLFIKEISQNWRKE